MAAQWEHVAPAWSLSDPGTRYEIKRRVGTQQYGCSCGAWRFHKETQVGPTGEETRTCKHIRRYFELLAGGTAGQYFTATRQAAERQTDAGQWEMRLLQLLTRHAPEVSYTRRAQIARELALATLEVLPRQVATVPVVPVGRVIREVVLED